MDESPGNVAVCSAEETRKTPFNRFTVKMSQRRAENKCLFWQIAEEGKALTSDGCELRKRRGYCSRAFTG
jgi:hypothetical protein